MNEKLRTEGSEISVGDANWNKRKWKDHRSLFFWKSAISDPIDFAKVLCRSVHKDQAEIDANMNIKSGET